MIINGKHLAEEILAELAGQIKNLPPLKLAAILVGDYPNNRKFLELKQKAAEKIGLRFQFYEFPEKISEAELKKEIAQISQDEQNNGVLLELPLPKHIPVQKILDLIPVSKDLDVLSSQAQGLLFSHQSKILPPAVEAVKTILEKNSIEIKGKNAAVFGYGLLIGRPVSSWLSSKGATVAVVNEHTPDPAYFSKKADLIISGVGQPKIIKAEMVKDQAVVIDFGISYQEEKVFGDVDFEKVAEKASLITPVPGGVGPLVVAAVLKNLLVLNS